MLFTINMRFFFINAVVITTTVQLLNTDLKLIILCNCLIVLHCYVFWESEGSLLKCSNILNISHSLQYNAHFYLQFLLTLNNALT